MHMSNANINRRLLMMLKIVLTRISILKKRKDTFYKYAFKISNKRECLIRECDIKISSKNNIRHYKITFTSEHQIVVIILQETNYLQCEKQ
jgi:hypothetical protein